MEVTSAVFGKSIWVRKNLWGTKRRFPPLFYLFPWIFFLILAYDSIYPILAPGLLFFPPHRETWSLVGAYVGAALVFHLAQFSIFDTWDLKLFFFSFRNLKTLKYCRLNRNAFPTFKTNPFLQVCLIFCFISRYRKLDTLIFEFTSLESRGCELTFNCHRKL